MCEIPETPHNDVNTCSVDNFLTVLLIHCKQNTTFLQDSVVIASLKNVSRQEYNLWKNVNEGKSIILSYLQSRQDLLYTNGISMTFMAVSMKRS